MDYDLSIDRTARNRKLELEGIPKAVYFAFRNIPHYVLDVLFDISKIQFAEGSLEITESEMREYNYRWIDFDECPQLENNFVILPHECLRLISYVMDDTCYDEDIELLLNSSRVLLTIKRMLKEIDFPYSSWKADTINAMVCSSLEPLSLILDKSNERCKKCGNMIFPLTKRSKKCVHAILMRLLLSM